MLTPSQLEARRHGIGGSDAGAVVYRGRRILLHRELYLAWIAQRSRRAAA